MTKLTMLQLFKALELIGSMSNFGLTIEQMKDKNKAYSLIWDALTNKGELSLNQVAEMNGFNLEDLAKTIEFNVGK